MPKRKVSWKSVFDNFGLEDVQDDLEYSARNDLPILNEEKEEIDDSFDTLLYTLISKGNIEDVQDILEKNSTVVNKPNDFGYTPLHLAAEFGHIDIIELLIEYGAEIDVKGIKDGVTPFHKAVE